LGKFGLVLLNNDVFELFLCNRDIDYRPEISSVKMQPLFDN